MSIFDAEIFANAIVAELTSLDLPQEAKDEIDQLKIDIEATLAALEVEKDNRRAKALRDDCAQFLPGRREAILISSKLTGGAHYELRRSLDIVTKATLIVARAFTTGGN